MEISNIPQPIVVVGIPRSGTSLTAGLFAAHGVWTGAVREADQKNPRGYFESIAFNRIWGEWWSDWWSIGRLIPDPKPGFRDKLLWALIDEGYRGGPWLIKHDIICFPVWAECSPIWICVRREAQAIAQSMADFFEPHPEAAHFHIKRIPLYEELLDYLVALGGHSVWMADLIRGEFAGLKEAFAHCGIEMNEEVVRSIVDPELEHFK